MRPDDYVLFDVAGKVWAGDRLVIDSFTSHQPQGLPLHAGLPAWAGAWPVSAWAAGRA